MARRIAAITLVLALGLLPFLAGGAARAEEEITLSFEGPIPLERFLTQVMEELEVPLVWDPKSRALQNKEVVGKLVFQGTKEEILHAVRGLLTFYELVLIPVGQDANEKLLVMDARQTAAIVKLKPQYVQLTEDNAEFFAGQDGLFLTTTIRVEHMESLRDARNALNRIVTGQNIGNVTEVPAARAFVVTDFAPNLVAIWRLVREMDVPFAGDTPDSQNREVIFQAVSLEHAEAEATASTLVQHFGANAPQRQHMQPGRNPQTQGAQVPPTPMLRIHADARLNQLLVTGMRKDVDRVLAVVQAMDKPHAAKGVVFYLRLEHIDAVGAATVLSKLIQGDPATWASTGTPGALPVVEAHPETNGLLVQANETANTALRRLIAEMDTPQAE